MTRFVVATNGQPASEALLDYLDRRLAPGDSVVVVASHRGAEATDSEQVRAGTAAVDHIVERVPEDVTAEAHQYVRGNEPSADILAAADAFDVDEILLAIRRRSPAGKLVFGSTAQDVLLSSDRPVVAVPIQSDS